MLGVDKLVIVSSLGELFINLTAGWLAAMVIFPITLNKKQKINFRLLTINLLGAIISLYLAIILKGAAR